MCLTAWHLICMMHLHHSKFKAWSIVNLRSLWVCLFHSSQSSTLFSAQRLQLSSAEDLTEVMLPRETNRQRPDSLFMQIIKAASLKSLSPRLFCFASVTLVNVVRSFVQTRSGITWLDNHILNLVDGWFVAVSVHISPERLTQHREVQNELVCSSKTNILLQYMYTYLSAWTYTRSSASQTTPCLQSSNLQSPMPPTSDCIHSSLPCLEIQNSPVRP